MSFYAGGTIHGNYVLYFKTKYFETKPKYQIGIGDMIVKDYDTCHMLIPCWEAFEAAS